MNELSLRGDRAWKSEPFDSFALVVNGHGGFLETSMRFAKERKMAALESCCWSQGRRCGGCHAESRREQLRWGL